ncbi:MAG: ATP-binding protein [Thermoleophilia bacterium]|nr:ATP-binding protein [Thermoleophilia bacterium]
MSEHVPGFTVEPAAIINMIRENLVDRYRDAYAIVKELIQNSDDAKATRMELGWCNGLGVKASHPLLKGPAVFVVNNGAFDSSNAKAIRRIYLSSKSNRRDSIGQFGLGMKSVFHVCEAFFYAWHCRGKERGFSGAEVLNPWGGLCHSGWNEFSQADQALLRHRLAPVIDGEAATDAPATSDWFALWLPLRLPSHSEADGDLIFERFYGDSPDDLGLFDAAVLDDLATLLPLLRHLELIRGWKADGASFDRVFEAALGRPSQRCAYKEGMSFGRTPLGGGITVRNSTAESPHACVFAGVEAYVEDDQLRAIMERPDWPRIETTDERNMPTAVRRKAEPHGAVCFAGRGSRNAVTGKRHLTLRIRWAVFLPLQPEHDEVVPPGSHGGADYTMTLHGWYFVDSGRQRIDMPASVRVGDAEANIRHEWNGRLMESATLPLLIPALDCLAESLGRDHPDLGELTGLLMRSEFFSVHRRAICSQSRWVAAFGQDGASWRVVGTGEPVLVLPGQPSDRDVAWRTFRALADLTRLAVVTFERAPRLCGQDEQEAWPLEAVEAMLAVDVAAVCGDAESLEYCASFVSSLPSETIESDRVQAALMALVRGALHTVGTREYLKHENQALRRALSRLIECVRATSVVGVTTPKGLDVAIQEVLTRLAGTGRGFLVVPDELRGRAEPTVLADAAGCVALVQEVGRLQTMLEQGQQGARTAAMTRACAWVARAALLSAADQTVGSILRGIDAIKLFPAMMYHSESAGGRVSVSELRSAQSSGTLFCGVPRYAKPLMGALPRLPLVGVDLSGDPILDEELQSRLLGNDRIPTCDLRLCARLVSSASELVEAREARMPLFEAMVRDAGELGEKDIVRCLRYLLHGQRRLFEREAEHGSGSEPLLVDDEEHESAWRLLFDAVVGCRGDHWRRLSAEACRKLNADQMRTLGVSRIDRGTLMILLEKLQPNERHGVSVDDEAARRELLRSWPESHLYLLKDVALHRRTGSKTLGPLDEHTFLRGSFQLPEELGGALSITLVEPSPEYDYWAQRGSALAETFGLEQALREVLRVREPERYWAFILDAVRELGSSCSEESKQQVSTTAWVPTASGKAVSPVRVLSIPALDDMLSELVGLEGPWHAWNDVAPEVKRHPASRGAVQRCLSVPDAAGALCQYLAQHNWFRIGDVGLNSREMFEVWLAALRSEGQSMPAARVAGGLVQDLGIEDAWSLVTKTLATGPLDLDRLERVLTAMRLHHGACPAESRDIAVRVHNEYLRLVAGHEGGASCLKRAQLLNQQGKWTPSTNLCVDSPGVSRAALLDVEQEAVIRRCLVALSHADLDVADAETPVPASADDAAGSDQLESAFRRSAADIERYFVEWSRRLSRKRRRGVLCVLGGSRGDGRTRVQIPASQVLAGASAPSAMVAARSASGQCPGHAAPAGLHRCPDAAKAVHHRRGRGEGDGGPEPLRRRDPGQPFPGLRAHRAAPQHPLGRGR